jgi:hypothetical protein
MSPSQFQKRKEKN